MCGGQTGLPAGIPGARVHGTADRPGWPGPLRRCAWALASPGKATLRPRGAAPLGGPEGAASNQAGQCVGDTGRERQWEVAVSERSVGNRRPAVRARRGGHQGLLGQRAGLSLATCPGTAEKQRPLPTGADAGALPRSGSRHVPRPDPAGRGDPLGFSRTPQRSCATSSLVTEAFWHQATEPPWIRVTHGTGAAA